jgi:uncharacterized protein YggE
MSEAAQTPIVPFGGVAPSQARGVGVPVSPGQVDVTADVTVVFELK